MGALFSPSSAASQQTADSTRTERWRPGVAVGTAVGSSLGAAALGYGTAAVVGSVMPGGGDVGNPIAVVSVALAAGMGAVLGGTGGSYLGARVTGARRTQWERRVVATAAGLVAGFAVASWMHRRGASDRSTLLGLMLTHGVVSAAVGPWR